MCNENTSGTYNNLAMGWFLRPDKNRNVDYLYYRLLYSNNNKQNSYIDSNRTKYPICCPTHQIPHSLIQINFVPHPPCHDNNTPPPYNNYTFRDYSLEKNLTLAKIKYKEEKFAESYKILYNLHNIGITHTLPPALPLPLNYSSHLLHPIYQSYTHHTNLIPQNFPNLFNNYHPHGVTNACPHPVTQNSSIYLDNGVYSNNGVHVNGNVYYNNGTLEHLNLNYLYNLSLTEKYYRTTLLVNPNDWNANIKLFLILSSSGRHLEAIEVLDEFERSLDNNLPYDLRYDFEILFCNNTTINHDSHYTRYPFDCSHNDNDVSLDRKTIAFLDKIEKKRIAYNKLTTFTHHNASHNTLDALTSEQRRDIYYAKGYLYESLGNFKLAKHEYHKSLYAIGIDLKALLQESWLGSLPPQIVSPQRALNTFQSFNNQAVDSSNHIHHNVFNRNPYIYIPFIQNSSLCTTYSPSPLVVLPSLSSEPLPLNAYNVPTSTILQTLAKLYKDTSPHQGIAVTLYYYSLGIIPTPDACNDIGILLAHKRLDESIFWYQFGLSLDPNHVHLLTNIGSAFKEKGNIHGGIMCYQKAISIRPDFHIVLVNLANVYRDIGKIEEASKLYKDSLKYAPNFTEAFCNYVNILLFICDWTDINQFLPKIIQITNSQLTDRINDGLLNPPTILPFHTFTYTGLRPWMIREISHRNAQNLVFNVATNSWFAGFPERPKLSFHKILSFLNKSFLSRKNNNYSNNINISDTKYYDDNECLTEDSLRTGLLLLQEIFRLSMKMISINSGSISVNVNYSDTFNLINQLISSISPIDKNMGEAISTLLHYPFPYPPPPPNPIMNIGYVSSDFNNHPLSHLVQSVFGMHDRSRYRIFCYALTGTDSSHYRDKIKAESDVFLDVSNWSTEQIVYRIVNIDKIHVLCNLNGYTKGARNDIFAARPAPVQLQFMGFAGTMGAGESYDPDSLKVYIERRYSDNNVKNILSKSYITDEFTKRDEEVLNFYDNIQGRFIDYLIADEIVCPRKFVVNEPSCGSETESQSENGTSFVDRGPVRDADDINRVYTESLIYMPYTYFINDHRQSLREDRQRCIEKIIFGDTPPSENCNEDYEDDLECGDETLTVEDKILWSIEQIRQIKARFKMFPSIGKDVVIYANFNQLYKIDPCIFSCWIDILKVVPNSILWLLRFPAAGEIQLKKRAFELGGKEIARRIVFTDVAQKQIHVYRGRVADIFLDTPECNAHTTAADIMWSGTPVVTYPKYDFKMCSRVCSSIALASGCWKIGDFEKIDGGEKAVMDAKAGLDIKGVKSFQNNTLLAHWMIAKSYDEYKKIAIRLGLTMRWQWTKIFKANPCVKPHLTVNEKRENIFSDERIYEESDSILNSNEENDFGLCWIKDDTVISDYALSDAENSDYRKSMISSFYPSLKAPTHLYSVSTSCLAGRLRMRQFLSRDKCELFNTEKMVRYLEIAYENAYAKFSDEWSLVVKRNELDILNSIIDWTIEILHDENSEIKNKLMPQFSSGCSQLPSAGPIIKNYKQFTVKIPPYVPIDPSYRRNFTRCIWVLEDDIKKFEQPNAKKGKPESTPLSVTKCYAIPPAA